MRSRHAFLAISFILLAAAASPKVSLAGDQEGNPVQSLSPQLATLLRAEMVELSGGIESVAIALASADWHAIEEASEKMHGSYIMKKSLTPSQAAELKQKLSTEFKQLDAAFHARALKLGQAAAAKDFELVAFHYSRLIESCASCHSKYATERFPGFDHSPQERHEH